MRKSQLAGITRNEENVKIVTQCPCPANQNLVRRTDRPAFANLQVETSRKQYLTVDYDPKAQLKQTGTSNKQHDSRSLRESSRRSSSCSCSGSRSINSETSQLEPSTINVTPAGQKTYKNKRDHDFLLTPSTRKQSTIRSASQGRVSSNSSQQFYHTPQITSAIRKNVNIHLDGTREQPVIISSSQKRPSSTSNQHTILSKSVTPNYNMSTKNLPCVSRSPAFRSVKRGYCSFGNSQLGEPQAKNKKNATLSVQEFVTLSQDTLKTTNSSASCMMDSVFMMSKVRTTRGVSVSDEPNRSFVDGRKFFSELGTDKCSTLLPVDSPCSKKASFMRSGSVSETFGDRKPAVKSTLKKQSSIRKQAVFPLLYSPEYKLHIILYCYNHKYDFLLKADWVEKYVDKEIRTRTLDWLIKIQTFFISDMECVYFMSVRLFDYSIVKLRLRNGDYQLAAIVAFWISMKYLSNSSQVKVPKLISLCNSQYSKKDILSMERNIMRATNFCLNIPDPLDFMYYYLRSANLENVQLLKHGAKFILECATLFHTFSSVEPPFQAANALYMAYQVLRKTSEMDINFLWYSRKRMDYYIQNNLMDNVKNVIAEKYEPLNKYLTAEKQYIAKMFYNI